jgi:hypothetical protein
MAAIVAVLTPHLARGTCIEDLIAPIMHAEAAIFTAKSEGARRKVTWSKEHPPLKAHPRLLGTRKNGTKAYSYDVDLAEVTQRDLHFDRGLLDQVAAARFESPRARGARTARTHTRAQHAACTHTRAHARTQHARVCTHAARTHAARKHTRAHARTHARTRALARARSRTRARTHAQLERSSPCCHRLTRAMIAGWRGTGIRHRWRDA